MTRPPANAYEVRLDLSHTFRRTLVVIATLIGVALLWFAHDVFLVIFAGLLLGILFGGIATRLTRLTKVPRGITLAFTVLSLVGIVVLLVHLLAPGVAEQVKQLEHDLPRSIHQLESYIGQYSWGQDLLKNLPTMDDLTSGSNSFLKQITGAFSTSLNVLVHIVLIFVIGIYFAAEPWLYRKGFLQIIPPNRRDLIDRTLTAVHDTLWWWVMSILAAMTSISVLAFIGLEILGVPLSLTLALVTGLLTFIPNFGPFLSAILPAMIGLMESPAKAGSVMLMYLVIQFCEAHLVSPLIQRHTIKLPPVIGIAAQLTFSILFGFMGLLLAVPLVATLMVLIQQLYVNKILEKQTDSVATATV